MASGLPVVAFDDAAAAECIRSGSDGVTVPLDSPQRFVEAAIQVASDPSRGALGVQARATSEGFTWRAIGDAFARELVQVARGAPPEDTGRIATPVRNLLRAARMTQREPSK
jgi:glycosyltransferase involved in cell wall biosynthesis